MIFTTLPAIPANLTIIKKFANFNMFRINIIETIES
jgi:hypothetical protein